MPPKIAAAILLVAGLVGVPLALNHVGANRAFAEVQKTVSKVRSVTFEYSRSVGDANASGFISHETQKIMFLGNDLGRIESSNGEVVVIDRRKNTITQLVPGEKKVAIRLGADGGNAIPNLIEQLCNLPSREAKNLPEREMNGKKAVGFAVEDLTIWVDATTRLPLYLEGLRLIGDRTIREVFDKFVYDIDLEDSLFSITVPDGYVTEKSDLGSLAEQHLNEDRKQMEAQRRKAEEAAKASQSR